MALYPGIAINLAQACQQYRQRGIGEEQLRQRLWIAVQAIVAVEEKEFRDYLRAAEGQLELLRFTVDQERLYENASIVVKEIEKRVKEYLSC